VLQSWLDLSNVAKKYVGQSAGKARLLTYDQQGCRHNPAQMDGERRRLLQRLQQETESAIGNLQHFQAVTGE